MVQPETWRAIWTAGGPILGLFIGAFLTRSWDRNKWINDNRKQEYRELLTVLTTSSVDVENSASNADDLDLKAAANRAVSAFHRVVYDRIFIAAEVEEMKLMQRWDDAVNSLRDAAEARQMQYDKNRGIGRASIDASDLVKKFQVELAAIRKSVVSAATNVSPMWADVIAFFDSVENRLEEMDRRE
jgi:hypothetical protein